MVWHHHSATPSYTAAQGGNTASMSVPYDRVATNASGMQQRGAGPSTNYDRMSSEDIQSTLGAHKKGLFGVGFFTLFVFALAGCAFGLSWYLFTIRNPHNRNLDAIFNNVLVSNTLTVGPEPVGFTASDDVDYPRIHLFGDASVLGSVVVSQNITAHDVVITSGGTLILPNQNFQMMKLTAEEVEITTDGLSVLGGGVTVADDNNSVFGNGTFSVAGAITTSGAGITMNGGSITMTDGSITIGDGDLFLTLGSITVTEGDVALLDGTISTTAASVVANGVTTNGRVETSGVKLASASFNPQGASTTVTAGQTAVCTGTSTTVAFTFSGTAAIGDTMFVIDARATPGVGSCSFESITVASGEALLAVFYTGGWKPISTHA